MLKHSEFELQPAQMQPSTWYATILSAHRGEKNFGPRAILKRRFHAA